MTIPTINLSMIPTFPAKVVGSGPITITKAGLTYTFGWNIANYSTNPAPDSSQVLVLGYNGATGATERYPLSAIQSGLQITASQISDATANGRIIITGTQAQGRTALGLGDIATLNAGSGLTPDSGTLRLANSGVSAGSYTNVSATVDAFGRVTAISSGASASGAFGQCRLIKSGSNIVLQPLNGNLLTINGVNQTVPSAGVSLAPTGLTPGTLYYIYAYMVSTTMTLEASTTASATSTSTGIEIKSGDATRTLVGMVYPITGPAFADTVTQRLVASYFNRLARPLQATLATTATVTATSFATVTGLTGEFLDWGDEPSISAANGSWAVTGAATGFARILFDASTSGIARSATSNTTTNGLTLAEPALLLTRGYHAVAVQAYRSAGTNVQVFGTSTGADFATTLSVAVQI